MENKNQGSLRATMLRMTLIPLFFLGLVITIFSTNAFSQGMYGEVSKGLKNLAMTVEYTYDIAYPGDYTLEGTTTVVLKKGDQIISGNYDIVDRIKKDTGVEITIFYYDTRIITTIMDANNQRRIGTGAHAQIVRDVLDAEEGHFFSSVLIDDVKYFAYYEPLFNSDGTIVGMIGVAKTASNVAGVVQKAIVPIVIFAILAMFFTAILSIRFTDRLVGIIKKIKEFLGQIATGDLSGQIHPRVLKRQDELGEMGRFTIHVQKSLRELIEFDTLTGLYNRRSGEIKLRQIIEACKHNSDTFCASLGDIDYFKKFNDEYGHECGDEVLKHVSKILKNTVGKKGFVSRWGGEEFLIVIERVGMAEGEQEIVQMLKNIQEMEVTYHEQILKVTMTFGLSEGNGESTIHGALKEADMKLYQGKSSGRNQVIK